jgi:uncharacterized delta-60 repeat protein
MNQTMTRWALLALLASTSAAAQTTTFPVSDPTWGIHGNGVSYLGFDLGGTHADRAFSGALLPDGRLLMAGDARDAATSRPAFSQMLAAFGDPDPTFGQNGRATVTLDGAVAVDMARLADGRWLYLASTVESTVVVIGRLHADGSPDLSFDVDGHRLISATAISPGAELALPARILVRPGGKAVAMIVATDMNYRTACTGLIQLLEGGSNDPAFGNGTGVACLAPSLGSEDPFAIGLDMLVKPDGSLLVGGAALHVGGSQADMAVAQVLANGLPDPGFGVDGWAFVGFDQGGNLNDIGTAIARDDSGRILLAGIVPIDDFASDLALTRLLGDGQADSQFGSQGRVVVPFGETSGSQASSEDPRGIVMEPDGQVLVGAYAYAYETGFSGSLVLRFDDTGQLDPWFGIGGIHLLGGVSPTADDVLVNGRLLQFGDYLYLPGEAINPDTANADFAVARLILPLFAGGFESPD